jgi:hypothetical protein
MTCARWRQGDGDEAGADHRHACDGCCGHGGGGNPDAPREGREPDNGIDKQKI